MNRNLEIEARLERSLRKQVRVPQLDGRFDAAVWARIDSAQAHSAGLPLARQRTRPRAGCSRAMSSASIVAIVLVVFFGAQSCTGVEVNVALPEVSPGFVERIVSAIIWPVTAVGDRIRHDVHIAGSQAACRILLSPAREN